MLSSLITTGMMFSQALFARAYGGTNYDVGYAIIQNPDGSYVVAGTTQSFGAGSDDFLILKLNASGGLDWAKTFGGPRYDIPYSITPTGEGGYIVAGVTKSFGAGYDDLLLIKLNASGELQWAKAFGGTFIDIPYGITQTPDGGCAVAGVTYSFGAGYGDILVLKLNGSGELEWAKAFGGTNSEAANTIIRTSDGGYAIAGYTESFGAGSEDFLVLKISSSGDFQWAKAFGGTNYDDAYSLLQTSDGGYAVVGWTESFGAGDIDILALKLSPSGEVEWARTLGGASLELPGTTFLSSDGGYLTAGVTRSFGPGDEDLLAVKISASGGLEWARKFGGTNYERAYSMIPSIDGGYAIVGYTRGSTSESAELLVLKIGSDGSYPGCIEEVTLNALTPNLSVSPASMSASSPSLISANCSPTVNSPNLTLTDLCPPLDVEEILGKGFDFRATGQNIYLFMPNQAQVSLTIYDAQGRVVQRLYDGVLSSGGHTFNPTLETKGVYMAVLRYQGGMKSLKIVR